MQIMPYFKFHGDQSFRRASSSSSIRQFCWRNWWKNIFLKLYIFPLDNISGRIECKWGPISCVMAISQSEELHQVRQFVNTSILLTNWRNHFFSKTFISVFYILNLNVLNAIRHFSITWPSVIQKSFIKFVNWL